MIDVHSHILFGVDDGARTIEKSLDMVREAEKLGIKVIIATPHFKKGVYEPQRVVDVFKELVHRASGYDVELKLGAEVFLSPEIPKLLRTNKCLTLNSSTYMLFELPFNSMPIYTDDIIYNLELMGITPIIAHPERNRFFLKDFDLFMKFKQRGCLVQLDAASITGEYGLSIKGFCKRIIKKNLADFVGSDAHQTKDYTRWYLQAHKKVMRWAGQEYTDKLFYENAKCFFENSQHVLERAGFDSGA